jgi:hypothetical protein
VSPQLLHEEIESRSNGWLFRLAESHASRRQWMVREALAQIDMHGPDSTELPRRLKVLYRANFGVAPWLLSLAIQIAIEIALAIWRRRNHA